MCSSDLVKHFTFPLLPLSSRPKNMVLEYGAVKPNWTSTAFRHKLNVPSVLGAIFGPTLLFAVVFWVLSFKMHYQSPGEAYFIVVIAFLMVCVFGYSAWEASDRMRRGDTSRYPSWFVVMFSTMCLGWVLAVTMGYANYKINMVNYYDVMTLNSYAGVDPSKMQGQQMADAGRVMFEPGVVLNLGMGGFLMNTDQYCVAPIVSNISLPLSSYDFWAVGINCCRKGEFQCGEYNNPHADGGLRTLQYDTATRDFFKLAVQQVEAKFHIQALHPIFLHWVEDPTGKTNAYRDSGFDHYLLGVLCFLAFQVLVVLGLSLLYSKFLDAK